MAVINFKVLPAASAAAAAAANSIYNCHMMTMVQTTRGFGNPCYSERVVVHLSESIWFVFLITYYQDHSERSWGVLNRVLAWLYPFAYFEHI